jgi:dihydroorotate dehydrogenase electron transfer subunit
MKKYLLDLEVVSVEHVSDRYTLLRLTSPQPLPEMRPGQFAELRVDGSPSTFLRRPISINYVDRHNNELWLLVAAVGDGTRRLSMLRQGDLLNCLLPLGHGFTMPASPEQVLLIGGGVGVAPLLYYGACLKDAGSTPTFLLGARSSADLLMLSEFGKVGRVVVTTEDGSQGEKGFVTGHSILQQERFDRIASCGPLPMMKAVAAYAKSHDVPCEVSLENKMACGLGACLCCVEPTKDEGNVCVCTQGPVLNINQLLWPI